MDKVLLMTAKDLQDIGITLAGHQKKIISAIDYIRYRDSSLYKLYSKNNKKVRKVVLYRSKKWSWTRRVTII